MIFFIFVQAIDEQTNPFSFVIILVKTLNAYFSSAKDTSSL